MSLTEARVKEILATVIDPALGHDIMSYRLVRGVELAGDDVLVRIDLPSHAYPEAMRRELAARIDKALVAGGARKVTVVPEVVTAYLPAPSDKAILKGPKNVVAVAAGKGGVGKSTVATNLALALRQHGATVGLLDADVYGPSVPTMLGEPDVPPGQQAGQKIQPAVHWGIKVISVGFFVEREGAVVWRGPMIHKLLQQFIEDVEWGALDYLVMDLPPGTGDAQLSLSQLLPITGAVMVTTPQEVSIIDVEKALGMWKRVEVPVLGVVENMSG